MAVTVRDLSCALRITSGKLPPTPIADQLERLLGMAVATIEKVAPEAPTELKDQAVVAVRGVPMGQAACARRDRLRQRVQEQWRAVDIEPLDQKDNRHQRGGGGMNWRFWQQEPETRDYTVSTTERAMNHVENAQAVEAATPAIIEACAGLWARAFSSATIEPDTPVTKSLTPATLASIGRQLFEAGEWVAEIEVVDGKVMLTEACGHEVLGTSPHRWHYRLDIPAPEALIRRFRPAESVVHLKYAPTTAEPWRGNGPVQNSQTSRSLAAALELRLSEEARTPTGYVVPTPDAAQDSGLQSDLKRMKGGNVLVPSMRADDITGGGTPPRNDWTPQRLGVNWPASLQGMRADVSDHIAAAAGVPAALLARQTDGSGRREAWRIFLFSTIAPLGRILLDELRSKLDTPDLTFDWKELQASDVQGRARAFASMVANDKMPIEAGRCFVRVADGGRGCLT